MTDYRYWEKLDVDQVLEEHDARLNKEEVQELRRKKVHQQTQEQSESVANTKKHAEALQSKTAVEALKAKGGMGARRRGNSSKTVPSEDTPTTGESEKKITGNSFADLLSSISDYLFHLLRDVEKLQSFTEKKKTHEDGYSTALRCLQRVGIFSQLKFATINAALLQLKSEEASATVVDSKLNCTIQDLNSAEVFLIDQSMVCLGLFAISAGDFALSADLCRSVLKRQKLQADAGVWIMRGLAFAGMGNFYLAHLHLKSALHTNPNYPGLDSVMKYMEQQETEQVIRLSKMSFQDKVEEQLHLCIQKYMYNTEGFSSEYPDLSRVTIDAIKFFVEMNTKPNAVSSSSAGQRTARGAGKHMDDEEMSVPLPSMATLSISSQGCQKDLLSIISEAINAKLRVRFGSLTLTPFQRLQRLVADIPNSLESFTLIVSLLLSQRLFYEAQILFVESMYGEAEVRYTACLLLLAEARRAMTKDGIFESKLFKKLFPQQQNSVIETDCLRVVQGLSYASYLNIAMCRYHYHHLEAHLSSSDDNDSDFNLHNNSTFINISQASALALCEHAMAICPGPEVLLRKIWILERMRRFTQFNEELTMLQTQLADRRTSPATMVVADYGLAQTLSQVYLTGFSLQITCHGDTAPSIGKNEDYEEIEKDINEQVRGIISQSYLSEQESFVQKLIRISEANNGEHLSELSELPQSLYSPISREFIPSNHWDKLLNSMEQRNRFLQQKFGQRKKVEV